MEYNGMEWLFLWVSICMKEETDSNEGARRRTGWSYGTKEIPRMDTGYSELLVNLTTIHG